MKDRKLKIFQEKTTLDVKNQTIILKMKWLDILDKSTKMNVLLE